MGSGHRRRVQFAACIFAATAFSAPSIATAQSNDGGNADRLSAYANTERPECQKKYAVVHEAAAYAGVNDFNGTTQTVGELAYARSQCIGDSENRWRIEANAGYVGEKLYKAQAFLLGVGVDYHPLKGAPGLTIVPVVRVGYEQIDRAHDNFVWGTALTVENVFTLGTVTREIDGKPTAIPGTQLILATRTEYTNRKSADVGGSTLGAASEQTTFYGMIGLDGLMPKGRWRWQTTASYQTLDEGAIRGFATFTLSARPLDESYDNYPWNFQVIGNVGDHGYRGILFNITRRFTESWK